MQLDNNGRIWRWLPWLVVLAALNFMVDPSLTQPQAGTAKGKKGGVGNDYRDRGKSSYDQLPPSC